MKRIIVCLLLLMPGLVDAKVLYSAQAVGDDIEGVTSDGSGKSGGRNAERRDAFAAKHRFYVGGMYDFSMWQNYVSDTSMAHGSESSGFDVNAGIRANDVFRIEADYAMTRAEWDEFSIDTKTLFVNLVVDARVASLYRFFYNQKLVPYVGAGAGITWADGKDIEISKATVPVMNVMAGLGIEFDDFFALDLGYRYVYMFKMGVEGLSDLAPRAHQLRAGIRLNF
ncbi:MAG: porin family protein [Alphaproteobacteria bacterium]|nr:porin family protein [Alphaproteobacteria bacterium]